jgi:hypothetical protein
MVGMMISLPVRGTVKEITSPMCPVALFYDEQQWRVGASGSPEVSAHFMQQSPLGNLMILVSPSRSTQEIDHEKCN